MVKNQHRSRGFTLIAALLLTVLLSGVAVGLLYMVSNEARMGGNDLEGKMSYYAAEAGMENLTSLLSQAYQTSQNPNAAALQALTTSSNWPNNVSGSNITNVTYSEDMCWPGIVGGVTVPCQRTADPVSVRDTVGAGQDAGMPANLIQFQITVTATRQAGVGQVAENSTAAASGASVTINRAVEVALLPAFEFGIFCDGDCDYFAGPDFNFGGRVHTNGSLFLASGSKLTFTDKIAAVGQVVMDQLENNHATSSGYAGTVYVPSAAGACPPAPGFGPATNCNNLPSGSWTGGFPPNAGTATSNWSTISTQQFNGFIITGATGAKKLQLPFVQGNSTTGPSVGAIDIIRKPTPGDSAQLSNSRLYNEATIRILLADSQSDLYPGETRSDSASQDIQIGSPFTDLSTGSSGYVAVPATSVTSGGNMYFATARKQSYGNNNWTAAVPTNCTGANSWPLFGQVTGSTKCTGAWLRVEYCPLAAGCGGNPTSWVGITTQWLGYGFARNYNQPPTHPFSTSLTASTGGAPLCLNFPSYPAAQCQNGISPAILILQQLQQPLNSGNAYGNTPVTANNWLPINFYDAREGEPRDTRSNSDLGVNCSPNGIMNAVELDVGNLWLWLKKSGPYSSGSGNLVNATKNNGYILYFSDHRGMIPDPRPITPFYNNFSGMSGLADVINSGSSTGLPDGALEPMSFYSSAKPVPYSPEDVAIKGATVNLGQVDNWGQANLGAGFGIPTTGNAVSQPYYIQGTTNNAIQCIDASPSINGNGSITGVGTPAYGVATAEWNMVTGPRHVLRLVDGGMDNTSGSPTYKNSYVPPTGGATATYGNGFTVASEEPVYVWGDYNTGPSDPFWPSENTLTTPHSATAIIADAVTLLSNPPAGNNTQSNGGSTVANVGWTDFESFFFPGCSSSCSGLRSTSAKDNRPGNDSYYRVAIAAGKSIPFPQPSWGGQDMGTDGGMHNFLRYLENRGIGNPSTAVNYAGSMISMYYSQYNTGIFKCCAQVYGAPKRNYFFDTLFLDPANLPPGTPMFQDTVSLSYHEGFAPQ